ncbi:membrane protein [Clostridium novyi A str. 4540]|nr:membrane protein [Clostridium novyi A str. 4540]KEH92043.1 membrane protein [Clostridium novyi A str. GD211209]KEH92122.1 membrane protein [Clostridium botulinum C/D str. It1]
MKNLYVFWKALDESKSISLFSHAHVISLIIITLLCIFIYIYRNSLVEHSKEKFISHAIAYILILHQVSIYAWYISNNKLVLQECLPLYPCRISIILSIIMLFNKSKNLFDILYFWGLGGASIALIFHDTTLYPFPHYIFIQFFISHGGIVISVLFMMFVHKYRPNLNSLKKTLIYTSLYFAVTIKVNYLTNSNYCYLRENPNLYSFNFIPKNELFICISTLLSFFFFFYILYIPFKNKYRT